MVQVSGELSNNGQPMRRFVQTFVLAPQNPKKYYVHNDIFRYQVGFIFFTLSPLFHPPTPPCCINPLKTESNQKCSKGIEKRRPKTSMKKKNIRLTKKTPCYFYKRSGIIESNLKSHFTRNC